VIASEISGWIQHQLDDINELAGSTTYAGV
jgi:hypothetical protein